MTKYIYVLTLFFFVNQLSAQWIQIESIPPITNVPSLFVEGNRIFAGGDSVIFISSDYGKNWNVSSRIDKENEIDFVSAIVNHQGKIFVGTYNFGIYVSTDNGISWTETNLGLTGAGATTISDFVIRGDSIYAGTEGAGIFVMNLNNPVNWMHFSDGLSFSYSYNINFLKLIDNVIYAGAGGNGYLYKNDDVSSVWQEIKYGDLLGSPLMMLDIIKLNSELFITSSYGLYKSKDGVNWTYINPGVGFIGNSNFTVHEQKIYVHFSKGAGRTFWFSSSDYGKNWDFLEDQFGVEVLNITVVDNKLFAGRLYGLWYLDLNTTGVNDDIISDGFSLYQNYPNPFNPVTKISYSIPKGGFVSLKIYDVLGKEVYTLINDEMNAGSHEIEFNGSNLASGVYYYQLRNGNFSETKKLMLLK